MQTKEINLSERTIFINKTNLMCIAINNKNSIDMPRVSFDDNYIQLPINTLLLFNSFICTDFSIGVFSSVYLPINKFDKIKNLGTSTFVKNRSNNTVYIHELEKSKTILISNKDMHEKIRNIENNYLKLLKAIAYNKSNVRGRY